MFVNLRISIGERSAQTSRPHTSTQSYLTNDPTKNHTGSFLKTFYNIACLYILQPVPILLCTPSCTWRMSFSLSARFIVCLEVHTPHVWCKWVGSSEKKA